MHIESIKVEDIKIPPHRGPPALKTVEELMESIRECGLIQPITVTTELVLVAGHHRLAACRNLGEETISAVIVEGSQDEQRARELDENLVRQTLSPVLRGRLTKERKALYERLNPEARIGGRPGLAGGGKSPGSTPSFATDLSRRTGRSKTSIREDVRIGSLPEEISTMVEGTPVERNRSQLLELARHSGNEQADLAREMVAGATSPEGVANGASAPVEEPTHGVPRLTKGVTPHEEAGQLRELAGRCLSTLRQLFDGCDLSAADAIQRELAVDLVETAADMLDSVASGYECVGVPPGADRPFEYWVAGLKTLLPGMRHDLVFIELCGCGGNPGCPSCRGTGGSSQATLKKEC